MDFKNLDYRSQFANYISYLLIKKYGSVENALVATEKVMVFSDELIRNIYECIDKEIPLFRLKELLTEKAKDLGLSEKEKLNEILTKYDEITEMIDFYDLEDSKNDSRR